jgi:hypothetical protein
MAKTYTYSDAITIVGAALPSLKVAAHGATMADEVNGLIWNFADFGFTLGEMTPFYLVPATQDYFSPLVTIPSDFIGLRSAELHWTDGSSTRFLHPLLPRRGAENTVREELPTLMAYLPETETIRLYPQPPASLPSGQYIVTNIRYKKQPTKVTTSTLISVLPFDDRYFPVFQAGLRWVGLRDTGSQAAPNAQATFFAMLTEMANREAYESNEDSQRPGEPLVNW